MNAWTTLLCAINWRIVLISLEATTAPVTQVTQGMALVTVQVCDKYSYKFFSNCIGDIKNFLSYLCLQILMSVNWELTTVMGMQIAQTLLVASAAHATQDTLEMGSIAVSVTPAPFLPNFFSTVHETAKMLIIYISLNKQIAQMDSHC